MLSDATQQRQGIYTAVVQRITPPARLLMLLTGWLIYCCRMSVCASWRESTPPRPKAVQLLQPAMPGEQPSSELPSWQPALPRPHKLPQGTAAWPDADKDACAHRYCMICLRTVQCIAERAVSCCALRGAAVQCSVVQCSASHSRGSRSSDTCNRAIHNSGGSLMLCNAARTSRWLLLLLQNGGACPRGDACHYSHNVSNALSSSPASLSA